MPRPAPHLRDVAVGGWRAGARRRRQAWHANVSMTLNVYAHALPNMQHDAADRLADMLHG